MVGRPRNPNREPASKFVRLTPKQHKLMLQFHEGQEPYGDTIFRALQQLSEIRKKVEALKLEIEELHYKIRQNNIANDELITILKKRDKEIVELKRQRKAMAAIRIEQ